MRRLAGEALRNRDEQRATEPSLHKADLLLSEKKVKVDVFLKKCWEPIKLITHLRRYHSAHNYDQRRICWKICIYVLISASSVDHFGLS